MSNTTALSTDLTLYLTTQLGTAICPMVLAPVTIISNVLLLLTIFKNPLKCFRTPATYFIVALALVDFITGMLIEPFFIMSRMVKYLTWSLKLREPYQGLATFGAMFSYVGLNSPFLLVLGLIWSQFIAITFPHRYRSIVTHAQGPRVYRFVVRVLHRVYLVAVRRSSITNLVSSGPSPSLDTNNSFAHVRFVHAFEIVS